jgi:hypothetical protein
MVNNFGERELPDFVRSKDFRLMWTHSKDAKSNPSLSLSASVNFATSSFEQNNLSSLYNPATLSQNTRSSSVALTKRFAGTPFMVSASARADQISRDSTVSFTLPDMTVSMSRINPFRRKNRIGKERWYEKIALSYTGRMSNSITTKEDKLKNTRFPQDWRNGVQHTIPVSASFNVLRYISLTPSFNYNERWYFRSVEKEWSDMANSTVVSKTVQNTFNRLYEYSFRVDANTKFYGFFKPSTAIFGEKMDMVRWVITPTVGYGARPDFGAQRYGYWNTILADNGRIVHYSPFENEPFGVPGRGEQSNINFSLGNNVEMKVKRERGDSIEFKKISLIENFSVGSSYNLAVDSFQLSNINTNLRLRITPTFGLSLSAAFDPYEYQIDNRYGGISRVDKYRWSNYDGRGIRLPQLISTGTSFGYNFSNDTFSKKKKEDASPSTPEGGDVAGASSSSPSMELEEADYAPFSMPWNLSVDYSMDVRRNTQMRPEDFERNNHQFDYIFSHNISFSGNISLTQNWQINGSAYYNITDREITYSNVGITRNLHCWSMSANFIPVGPYRSYNFMVSVNSTLLRDLKYEQRNNPRDNMIW